MPFGESAVVELVNEDQQPRDVEFEITHAPLDRPFEGLGHFHCKWHRDTVEMPQDRWPDWAMLQTEGRGRFCGVMLHVWNPRGGWWGEGDEKLFVDGEKFPSTIGTGSEDYFGYAWCNPNLFQRPYHCQTMDQNNKGHQSVLRWHCRRQRAFPEDRSRPASRSTTGSKEKGDQVRRNGGLVPGARRRGSYGGCPSTSGTTITTRHPSSPAASRVNGTPPGNVQTQGMGGYREPGRDDDQLWWTGARRAASWTWSCRSPRTALYDVSGIFTKARDYGIVQLYLDGKKAWRADRSLQPVRCSHRSDCLGRVQAGRG